MSRCRDVFPFDSDPHDVIPFQRSDLRNAFRPGRQQVPGIGERVGVEFEFLLAGEADLTEPVQRARYVPDRVGNSGVERTSVDEWRIA